MRIDDHLYLVGSGDYGFNFSNRLDCNSYVLDTGDGLWMIDAGFDGTDKIVENMRRCGLDPHTSADAVRDALPRRPCRGALGTPRL